MSRHPKYPTPQQTNPPTRAHAIRVLLRVFLSDHHFTTNIASIPPMRLSGNVARLSPMRTRSLCTLYTTLPLARRYKTQQFVLYPMSTI